jgi:hypothetical protein
MVVTIHPFKGLAAHPEEAGRLPRIDAALHQPSCAGVPECVRRDADEASPETRSGERLLDAADRLAVDMDDRSDIGTATSGA